MEKRKLTDFGLQVKIALLKKGVDQSWLASKVTEQTGLFADSSYLYKILTGQRNAPRITEAISSILNLEKTSCAKDRAAN